MILSTSNEKRIIQNIKLNFTTNNKDRAEMTKTDGIYLLKMVLLLNSLTI